MNYQKQNINNIQGIKKLTSVNIKVNDTLISALVDTGASNSIISKKIANSLNLESMEEECKIYRLANGTKVSCSRSAIIKLSLDDFKTTPNHILKV